MRRVLGPTTTLRFPSERRNDGPPSLSPSQPDLPGGGRLPVPRQINSTRARLPMEPLYLLQAEQLQHEPIRGAGDDLAAPIAIQGDLIAPRLEQDLKPVLQPVRHHLTSQSDSRTKTRRPGLQRPQPRAAPPASPPAARPGT